ncbi:MAG: sensor domain-containing diguanylate cyclase [Halothiobacillus sp. 14-56-357]|jgi:diguanylate cyclase (GGDEF)-like protein/PAS domain S-box-containing protein|uniref:sensor domain-containing diguanylate cyclase n=1 Tax=Halothiobacillus sp. 15-55-196 TaxID=1970382 RepID=UPI000BCC3E03|nr:diguanylate cyclase [Halothiobacillus sp. 15-55-196]OZB35624.1 MAG: sensor domain-containing diguanylate cyclase [Halothiobacillus sp. 15-55-196]OZB57233.1 MAG: sensor domain-containing diguanylate cyclase [Halothiobacillus sp. 14-56-357]OZB79226.1 MAG: sensor domain-containing diguanylate cyclase [Halothiobacillus sp. 13-55-115]
MSSERPDINAHSEGLPALERTLFDAIPDAVYLIDPVTSNILDCNRHAYEDLYLTREQVLNHSVLSLQTDVRGLPAWAEIADVIRQNRVYRFHGHHRRPDGSSLPVEVNTQAVVYQGREWFVSVARDITKRQCSSQSEQDWSVLYDLADGVWDWRVADGSLYFSPNLKRFLGYGPDEMEPVLSTWKDNVHPDDLPIVLGALDEHLPGRRSQFFATYRLRNRNGFYLWVEDHGVVTDYLPNGEPARVVGFINDVTDYKTLEVALQKEATRDSLTGLFNRRRGMELLLETFNETVKPQSNTRVELSLLVIDLDFFKRINDLYGHLEGDEVLRIAGSLILKSLPENAVAFRWGGEEFLVALPGTSLAEARERAEKIRQAFVNPEWPPGIEGECVTVSIGIAQYPQEATQLIELIAAADKAVYRAKRLGRNRVESNSYELLQ